MRTPRYERLDRIFAEALQLPAEQRAAFVAQESGADVGLHTEVLSLLAAADEAGAFMERPALDRLSEVIAAEGWTLAPGDRIGAYTVVGLLGSGGAGEVWRARDERLSRDVAIKVLLPHLSADRDRLRRFADEARTAGALNHSNIIAVYDVGEHRGFPYLVSECLDGESLRTRLTRGSLSVESAVTIALQGARGLAAAHARGIIHRDLKPDNMFLRSDGVVKILDFGLAKLQTPGSATTDATTDTMSGVIVGTAGYMAPEQVRGEEVNARADLFALGVVLFEMLTGRRPFTGQSTFETLHAILTVDAPDLADDSPHVPAALAEVVKRLLEKAPGARFQSAADLAWALERLAGSRTEPAAAGHEDPRTRRIDGRRIRWIAAAAAAGLLLTSVTWWMSSPAARDPESIRLTRFTWSLPRGTGLGSEPVVSPDNRRIAFVGQTDVDGRLFVRHLASLDATAIAGTEGATQPFWSPDGKSLGFFANGKLMKVALDGGTPIVIADAPDARGGGAWSTSGVIVFQPIYRDSGLSRVSANGGPVEPATLLDISGPDLTHRWPAFLPDGVHFVYFVQSLANERRGVYVGSLSDPPAHPSNALFRASSGAVYVPEPGGDSGWLLSAEDRWIEARPFDAGRLAVTGDARKIEIAAPAATAHHAGLFSASADVLAFGLTQIPIGTHVGSMTRTGTELDIWPERALGGHYRLSPDGRRLARHRVDAQNNADIWVHDLIRGTQTRVTTSRHLDVVPAWSPDGQRIVHRSGTNASPKLDIVKADGLGSILELRCPRPNCEPTDWTPDDDVIVNVSGGDVWAVPIDQSKPPRPLLAESFNERDARVSPDGRWIAYVSDETGRPVVSVRSLSPTPRRFVVSESGGDQPVWRRDGAELFYVNERQLLQAVSVRPSDDGGLGFGLPRALKVPAFAERHWGTVYDVSPDGTRVYFPHPGDERPPREFGVLLGWRALLQN